MLPALLLLLASSVSPAEELASSTTWRKLSAGPPPRFATNAVFVPSRGTVLLHAGEIQVPGEGKSPPTFDFLDDAWEHDPAADTWKKLESRGAAPSARAYHAAAFDGKREALWIFGGTDRSFTPMDDLWQLDVAQSTWRKVEPMGEKPPARFSATLHYDPKRDHLVLHGGCKAFLEADNALPDVWVLDIAKNAWTKKAAGPPRWQAAGALAPELDLLVLHGGYDGNFTPKGDTWIYQLANDAWVEAGKGFKTTDAHAAAWDPATKVVLFHGGATASKSALEGVWAFEPVKKKWKEIAAKGAGPGPRAYHAATLLGDGRLWVFGGTENQFNDPLKGGEVWVAKLRK